MDSRHLELKFEGGAKYKVLDTIVGRVQLSFLFEAMFTQDGSEVVQKDRLCKKLCLRCNENLRLNSEVGVYPNLKLPDKSP